MTLPPNRDPLVESYKARCIRATKGNQSRLGCLIVALFGLEPKHPPRIMPCVNRPDGTTIGGMIINRAGTCIVNMELRNGRGYLATPIGDTTEMQDNLRGLADHLKLADADREDLFRQLQLFIIKDFRAESRIDQ